MTPLTESEFVPVPLTTDGRSGKDLNPGPSLAPDGRLYSPAMPKVCHICAKGPSFGHSRSHSMVATKRRFEPNLQRVRIDDGGTPRRVYVCTRCLKAGKVTKAR